MNMPRDKSGKYASVSFDCSWDNGLFGDVGTKPLI
jgi:hypothetical protein